MYNNTEILVTTGRNDGERISLSNDNFKHSYFCPMSQDYLEPFTQKNPLYICCLLVQKLASDFHPPHNKQIQITLLLASTDEYLICILPIIIVHNTISFESNGHSTQYIDNIK